MKKIIMLAAGMLCLSAQAVDYPWVTFTLTDNSQLSVPSDRLEAVYSDGTLAVNSGGAEHSFAVSSLKSMKFSTVSSGIEMIKATDSVELFDTKVVCVGKYDSLDQARKSLPQGLYIAKSGSKTFKIIL